MKKFWLSRAEQLFEWVPKEFNIYQMTPEELQQSIVVRGDQNAHRAFDELVKMGKAVCLHQNLITEDPLPGGIYKLTEQFRNELLFKAL